MPNPYAARVAAKPDPFPEARLRSLGATDDLVAYWREAAAAMSDEQRDAMFTEWAEDADDNVRLDVLGIPDPPEADVEWEAYDSDDAPSLDDVPRNAAAVMAWVREPDAAGERLARARVALTVEEQRSMQRVTVVDPLRELVGG